MRASSTHDLQKMTSHRPRACNYRTIQLEDERWFRMTVQRAGIRALRLEFRADGADDWTPRSRILDKAHGTRHRTIVILFVPSLLYFSAYSLSLMIRGTRRRCV